MFESTAKCARDLTMPRPGRFLFSNCYCWVYFRRGRFTWASLRRLNMHAKRNSTPPVLMHRNMNNHLLSSPVITIHGNSPIYTDGLPGIPNLELLMCRRPSIAQNARKLLAKNLPKLAPSVFNSCK
jgi:hypothetical protein